MRMPREGVGVGRLALADQRDREIRLMLVARHDVTEREARLVLVTRDQVIERETAPCISDPE
jgi:hypothetical protein